MRIKVITGVILMCMLSLITGCKRNAYKINISGISADIELKRLEKDLFDPDPSEIPKKIEVLKEKYGDFFQFFSYVIKAGDVEDPSFSDLLVEFCTDRLNNEVYSEVIRQYPEIESLERQLEDAFRHYLWYFPGNSVPEIYTCITGFNRSIITIRGASVLGIGLDGYLGKDSDYYPRLGIYRYVSARMNSYNIVPDCMYALAATLWDFEFMNYQTGDVLTEMIHEGKLKYFERCMLPETGDTLLFGFTADQMKFCRNNERQIWQYLVEHDLLFSTDQMVVRKLVGEAPFTSYFTVESPGRAAVWIGYRIVENFMENNKEVDLETLMENTDIQGLLEKAGYNPQ